MGGETGDGSTCCELLDVYPASAPTWLGRGYAPPMTISFRDNSSSSSLDNAYNLAVARPLMEASFAIPPGRPLYGRQP